MSDSSTQNPDIALCESRRCLGCKNPACTNGCPVGWNIPEFLRLATQGDFDAATQTVGHLFGEVCGYVCARDKQCKGHCVLAKKSCGVDVGVVERNVFAMRFPQITKRSDALSGVSVAVVGGGVSGLTFAEQCVQHGAKVTVYEQNQLLHTLKSIPDLRLPKEALARIENAVTASPICVVYRKIDAVTLDKLRQDNDVVYLATGAMQPNALGIQGEEFVTIADDFLRGNYCGSAIVIGGGNTAMDCALLHASKGYETTVCYRRARTDMPAFDSEVDAVVEKGASFVFNVAPLSVTRSEGKLTVVFAKTVSEGRGKLVLTDQTFELQCDILVAATGNTFDSSVFKAERFVHTNDSNNVCDSLYAGGDATGKGLVVWAVADALNAFRAVLQKFKR